MNLRSTRFLLPGCAKGRTSGECVLRLPVTRVPALYINKDLNTACHKHRSLLNDFTGPCDHLHLAARAPATFTRARWNAASSVTCRNRELVTRPT
jgi:hypothetical protein